MRRKGGQSHAVDQHSSPQLRPRASGIASLANHTEEFKNPDALLQRGQEQIYLPANAKKGNLEEKSSENIANLYKVGI